MKDIKIKEIEDRAWRQMKTLLDKEMPEKRKRMGFAWFWYGAVATFGIAFTFLWYDAIHKHNVNSETTALAESKTTLEDAAFSEATLSAYAASQEIENTTQDPRETSSISENSKIVVPTKATSSSKVLQNQAPIPKTNIKTSSEDISANSLEKSDKGISRKSASIGIQAPNNTSIEINPLETSSALIADNETMDHATGQINPPAPREFINLPVLPYSDLLTLQNQSPILNINMVKVLGPNRGNDAFAGLNLGAFGTYAISNPGQVESGIGIGYGKSIGRKFVATISSTLAYSNLDISYSQLSYQVSSNDPLFGKATESNTFLNNTTSSTNLFARNKNANLVSSISLGIGYTFNDKWMIAYSAGVKRYFQGQKSILRAEYDTPGAPSFANGADSADLYFKNHFIQSLGITRKLSTHFDINAQYHMTGQSINGGYLIDQKIKTINHLVTLGLGFYF